MEGNNEVGGDNGGNGQGSQLGMMDRSRVQEDIKTERGALGGGDGERKSTVVLLAENEALRKIIEERRQKLANQKAAFQVNQDLNREVKSKLEGIGRELEDKGKMLEKQKAIKLVLERRVKLMRDGIELESYVVRGMISSFTVALGENSAEINTSSHVLNPVQPASATNTGVEPEFPKARVLPSTDSCAAARNVEAERGNVEHGPLERARANHPHQLRPKPPKSVKTREMTGSPVLREKKKLIRNNSGHNNYRMYCKKCGQGFLTRATLYHHCKNIQ